MIFRSNGKLLFTGEYLILKGAKALAVPTSFSQQLEISEQANSLLSWESFFQHKLWFRGTFSIPNLEVIESNHSEIAQRLVHLLKNARNIKPEFLNGETGYKVTSKADFKSNWGLGSSSSLISNISYCMTPPGAGTSTVSPTSFPINALPIGESTEILFSL